MDTGPMSTSFQNISAFTQNNSAVKLSKIES